MNDLKFAFRQLFKHSGSTAMAVLILGLGIGGTTAVFSVAEKVLLHPVPVRAADQLIVLRERDAVHDLRRGVSPPVLAELELQTNTFQALVAFHEFPEQAKLSLADNTIKINGARITPGFFEMFGTRPLLGRVFRVGEGLPGGDNVVVVSFGLWQQRFGGRADLVGRAITLNGIPHTVIGIMPPQFQFPFGAGENEFWMPQSFSSKETADPDYRIVREWSAIARLQDGVSGEQAEALFTALSQRWQKDYPDKTARWELEARPASSLFVPETVGRSLWSLQAAVAMLLLIACANVSILLLAKVLRRRSEFGVRMVIGASHSRVRRMLMMENLALAALAGAAGLYFAWAGIRGLQSLYLGNLPRIREIGLDWSVLGIGMAVSLVTSLVFGAAPVWFTSRLQIADALKEAPERHTGGLFQKLFQDGLVVMQLSLAVVLLAGSGLMIRSTVKLLRLDPGLHIDDLYVFDYSADFWNSWTVDLDTSGRERFGAHLQWLESVVERLQAIPEVESVAMGDNSQSLADFLIEGLTEPVPLWWKNVGVRQGNYFQTLQARLLAGRFLEERDCAPSQQTVVIDRVMARRCWPGGSALGKRFSIREDHHSADYEVVGVIESIRDWRRDIDPQPTFFVPIERSIYRTDPGGGFFLRSALRPEAIHNLTKKVGLEMLPPADSPRVFSVEQQHAVSTAPRRIFMWLLVSLGELSLLLSALGIYAVMAFAVIRRMREIGVRMALGAQREQIRNQFIRQGARLAFNGVVLGLVAAITAARYIESLLYQVEPGEPWTFAGAVLVLGSVAMLACWLPARRATRVNPMEALRYE